MFQYGNNNSYIIRHDSNEKVLMRRVKSKMTVLWFAIATWLVGRKSMIVATSNSFE